MLHVELSGFLHNLKSAWRGGYNCPQPLERIINHALHRIFENCVPIFSEYRLAEPLSERMYVLQFADYLNIEKDDCLSDTLLFNNQFSTMV